MPSHAVKELLVEVKALVDLRRKIDADVREVVNNAAEFAQNDPEPDASELWTDIVKCVV